jgi:hypothetical protein
MAVGSTSRMFARCKCREDKSTVKRRGGNALDLETESTGLSRRSLSPNSRPLLQEPITYTVAYPKQMRQLAERQRRV